MKTWLAKNHRARVAAALIACSACVMSGCEQPATPASPKPVAVTLDRASYAVAQNEQLISGPPISGTIVPRVQAVLRAQVSGNVLETRALPGQYVDRGEVLVRLENADLEQASRSAQAAVQDALTRLHLAERQKERQTMLLEAGAIARRDLEQAVESQSNAASALAQARSNLAQARKRLQDTQIEAPFAGQVSEKQVSRGDVVQVGAALYTLVDLATNELAAFLPPGQAGGVHVGTPVRIRVLGREEPLHGTVTRVNPSTDPTTRQVRIYASFGAADRTLPAGLFAEGRAIVERKTTLAVPEDALERNGDEVSVAAIRDGIVCDVPVAVGMQDPVRRLVEIRSGLASGERVLRGAARNLSAGIRVAIAENAGPTATAAQTATAGPTATSAASR